jgi:hypothetical protein
VDCYLPYFRQRLITHPLSALLPFQSLFTERSHGDHLLASTPFSGALSAPHPLCCMSFSFPCLLYIYLFIYCKVEVSLPRGLCWFIPGVAVGIPCATYLLTCWSVSPKQVWTPQRLVVWEPSCFLSVMWCGDALYGLGVQGAGVLILFGGLFPPSVAPASQQKF